jgi:uncharacterized membrane protein HdeD (DUF308 family)
MVPDLSRRWWALAVRGVAGILFAILAVLEPGLTLFSLVLLFGAYALVDGAFAIGAALSSARQKERWGYLLFEGIVGVAAGVLTFVWPGMSALVLLLVVGAWAVITGAAAIGTAIRLRKIVRNEWVMAAFGVLSVAFGIFLLVYPAAGSIALLSWIAAYAFVSGILMLVLAFKLRGLRHHRPLGQDEAAARA